MTGKENVRAAIRLQVPREVPLGFYVADYDTIERVIGRKTLVRNKAEMQIALWEGRRDEVADMCKKDTVEFYRQLDCVSLIAFKEAPLLPPKDYEPDPPRRIDADTWEDRRGRLYRRSTVSNEIAVIHDPTLGTTDYTVEMFSGPVEVTPPDPSIFEAVDYLIQELGADRYIAGTSGGFVGLTLLGGMTHGLMLYYDKPEVIHAFNRQAVQRQAALDPYMIRPGQDGILAENDMASTQGPLISPAMFREFSFPYMRQRVQRYRQLGYDAILHNCGNNVALIPSFIEAGIQCYQSLQTIPDMEIGRLKAAFGDRLCLWGGVPTELLLAGTPGEVRAAVRRAFEAAAPGGGFILGPSHSIAKGTRYENFMAMLDEYDRLKDRFRG